MSLALPFGRVLDPTRPRDVVGPALVSDDGPFAATAAAACIAVGVGANVRTIFCNCMSNIAVIATIFLLGVGFRVRVDTGHPAGATETEERPGPRGANWLRFVRVL